MATKTVKLHLTIHESGADLEQLDSATRQLMVDLGEVGVASVERVGGEPIPEGAKSGSAFTWGALALTSAPEVLPSLIEFLQTWALGGAKRAVTIKTPSGLEVEFTPQKPLSQDDLVGLVEQLSQV
jgi:hypothetical protein